MTLLKFYKYPHPILRVPGEPVTVFDTELADLVRDMTGTLYDCPGAIGLAAPQVGHSIRLFLLDMTAKTTQDQLRVFINPIIVQQSRNKLSREGCLSFPDYLANVRRATRITVSYQDVSGQTLTHDARDLEAVAIQHELDHLDGILMIDRIESLKTDWIRRGSAPAPGPDLMEAEEG